MRTRGDRLCEKFFFEFFTCGCTSLLSALKEYISASGEDENQSKIQVFESRSFRLRVLGGRSNVGNRLVGPQMTSQIAGIDILHVLAI